MRTSFLVKVLLMIVFLATLQTGYAQNNTYKLFYKFYNDGFTKKLKIGELVASSTHIEPHFAEDTCLCTSSCNQACIDVDNSKYVEYIVSCLNHLENFSSDAGVRFRYNTTGLNELKFEINTTRHNIASLSFYKTTTPGAVNIKVITITTISRPNIAVRDTGYLVLPFASSKQEQLECDYMLSVILTALQCTSSSPSYIYFAKDASGTITKILQYQKPPI
jgi:hypothetical protein